MVSLRKLFPRIAFRRRKLRRIIDKEHHYRILKARAMLRLAKDSSLASHEKKMNRKIYTGHVLANDLAAHKIAAVAWNIVPLRYTCDESRHLYFNAMLCNRFRRSSNIMLQNWEKMRSLTISHHTRCRESNPPFFFVTIYRTKIAKEKNIEKRLTSAHVSTLQLAA